MSALNGSPIWQVGEGTLTEWANKYCPNLMDSKYVNNDFLIVARSVKGNAIDKEDRKKTGNKNIPDNLIRHQFMMFLVKVANDKYLRRNNIYIIISYSKNN